MAVIGERLAAIAAHVPPGSRCVADVGADHAHLAIHLVRSGRAAACVVVDVRPAPLDVARRHVERARLDDRIALRLGDGLQPLGADEVDVVVAAGLGGATVGTFLARDLPAHPSVRRVIAQPLGDAAARVRSALRDARFGLVAECVVDERGYDYDVLVADRLAAGVADDPAYAPFGAASTDFADRYGPLLVTQAPERVRRRAQADLERLDGFLAPLRGSSDPRQRAAIERLEQDRALAVAALDFVDRVDVTTPPDRPTSR